MAYHVQFKVEIVGYGVLWVQTIMPFQLHKSADIVAGHARAALEDLDPSRLRILDVDVAQFHDEVLHGERKGMDSRAPKGAS